MDIQVIKNAFPILLKGSAITLQLTVMTVIIGTLLGVLLALMKISKSKILYSISALYIWLFRGTPLLLQLFFFYFGLPSIGLKLTATEAATISLSLNSAAYMAEIIRGGILSIDKGQFEASKALGFTYTQTMIKVILPQTFKVIIPPAGNEFIAILKDTSLVSTIAMVELMRSAQQIYSATFRPLEIYFIAACLYLAMTTIFTSVFSFFEKKLSVY